MCTVDSKDVFDLLLYHFQSHFNPIGISHSMDLIGVKSVDVQDLNKKKKTEKRRNINSVKSCEMKNKRKKLSLPINSDSIKLLQT